MKPDEARRQRKAQEQASAVRGQRLEAILRNGEPKDKPRPDLVPNETDRKDTLREYRRLARLAAGEPERSRKRARLLDRVVVELARLVYIERCLALDPLERAALDPGRLTLLSVVDPEEIRRRFDALQGDDERLEGLL